MRNKDAIELLLKDNSWPCILSEKPSFANMCEQWDKFEVKDWKEILGSQPHFANKCNIWKNFNGIDWHDLLYSQPLFIDKCAIEKLSADTWVILLEKYPQLASKCDKWDEITGKYWSRLLQAQPQFFDKCDWNKLDAADWSDLLEAQPQFADKCNLWEQFEGWDWCHLLEEQSQFADKCPWEKLDSVAWRHLLAVQPQLADKCHKWNQFSDKDWVILLAEQPQFADKCDWDKEKKYNWGELDYIDWCTLLKKYPQFADKCDKWDELYDDTCLWIELLKEQPKLADKCNFDKLEASDQAKILQYHPQLEHKCNKLGEIPVWSWIWLLKDQPQFSGKCNKWDEFDGENWSRLLKEQPQFADKCNWNKLDAADWLDLLKAQPQFADKCDEWDEFDAWSWRCLLQKQPQFANKCPFGSFNGDNWVDLLVVLPDFINNCYLDLLTGENWCAILKKQPQLSDKCNWSKFDGKLWVELLHEQPQLADKCQWGKLNGALWVELLNTQPQLAENCDWDKLDGAMWTSLLSTHPEFADKCNWDKLDGDGSNWRLLLSKQPQFADKCDWDNQDVITDKKILEEYKKTLIEFLTDFTKLESNKFNTLSIIKAKNYHEYKLVIDDTAISRCFKQYTKKTQEKEISSGNDLDKSSLWRVRTDLLQDVEKLKADGDTHFNITLSDCISVIECTNCHGKGTETCSHCNGRKVKICHTCDGSGEMEWRTENVPCPRCSHLTNPGWIGSKVCDLCGNKSHYAKKIHYKGQKYAQRVEDSWDILDGNGGSGRLHRYDKKECWTCNGSGEVSCNKCDGTGLVSCDTCGGNGKLETGWKIEQQLIEHKKSTTRIWVEQLPLDLEKAFYEKKISSDISTMSLFKKWYVESCISNGVTLPGKITFSDSENFEVKGFRKKATTRFENALDVCRRAIRSNEHDCFICNERVELYRQPVFTKVLFQYLNQTYCIWFDCNDKNLIYDFSHDGFTSAWNRAKTKLMQNLGSNQKEFSDGVNYLGIIPGNITDEERKNLPNDLFSHTVPLQKRGTKSKILEIKAEEEKTATTSKEEKKKETIFTHKNISETKAVATDKNNTFGEEPFEKLKSRNIYAALAIFLPGVHNLYAGYIARGIIQLLIAVCSLGLGLFFTWPWALFEASCIKTDAKKNLMRPGWLQWIPRSILIIAIIVMVAAIIHDKMKSTETNSTATKIKESLHSLVVEAQHKAPGETTKQASVEDLTSDYTSSYKSKADEYEKISFSESFFFDKIKEKITLKKVLIVFIIFAVVGIIMGCCNIIYLFSGAVDIIISAFLALGTVLTWYFWRDNAINDTEAYCLLGTIGVVFIILSLFTTPGKYWAILFVFPGKVLLSFLGMISILLVFKSCLTFFKEGRKEGGRVFLELLIHAGILFGTGKLICMTTREKVQKRYW